MGAELGVFDGSIDGFSVEVEEGVSVGVREFSLVG